MSKELKRKLRLIFFEYDWSGIELVFSLYAIFWGIILMLPFDTFATPSSISIISLWSNEFNYGLATFLMGAISLICLIRNSLYPSLKSLIGRKWCCFLSLVYWGFMMALFIIGNKYGLGLSWCFVTVSFLMINYWRLVAKIRGFVYDR